MRRAPAHFEDYVKVANEDPVTIEGAIKCTDKEH